MLKKFDLSDEEADKLSKIDFNKQAYANKSHKAIRNILPYLMQGFDYSQACSLAGYNHSNSLTKQENEERQLKDKLSLIPKNGLRQPVVEKILNQMIHVVNSIIEKYGRPTEIRVELARELKQSKDERNDADSQNLRNKKINEEIGRRLTEMGIPATRKYIQKYKFIFPVREKTVASAKVLNQCIYCGETFNLSEALKGDSFDVDHIVPKALLFDDSQMNKVLVHRSCNATKDRLTAYDYIANKGEVALSEYLERVDDWYARNVISYGKMLRLKVSHKEYLERKKLKKETEADKRLWENFIDRQLRETSYISRKAKQILSEVCRNVTATEGTVTATLRKLWGWDNVLMNLQLPKYRLLNQTEVKEWSSDNGKNLHREEVISDWTKRDDHRHHAIDALVVACTRQGYIQRINTLNSSDTRNEMNRDIEASKVGYSEKLTLLENYLVSQKPFTTSEVEKEADKILVSFKPGKKVATISKFKATGKNKDTGVLTPRGALHEQFVYGKIKVIDYDKPIKYLFDNTEKIVDEKIRNLVQERKEQYEGSSNEAIKSLKKNPIFLDSDQKVPLEKANCFKDEYVIKYKLHELKQKDLPFIVDQKVKRILKEKLKEHNGNEKEAFKNGVWFNEEKQIPIRTVRCFTGLSAVEPIRKDEQGKDIGFAKTGNNHHVAIYQDKDGKQTEHSCTFWYAVERKKYEIPVIIENTSDVWNSILNQLLPQTFIDKLPEDGLRLIFSLQQK